jgi:hypothetical protein
MLLDCHEKGVKNSRQIVKGGMQLKESWES